jgi:uncharacterized protein (TIGR00725 family)
VSRATHISVIGFSAPDPELDEWAEEVGRLIAEAGAILVCGGRDGVMEAASRGARAAGGDVLAILPDDDPGRASANATHVVATGAGYTRNLAVAASGDAMIALGGKWGTLSEIAFARNLGRPVFALGSWQVRGRGELAENTGIEVVETPAEAVERALAAAG